MAQIAITNWRALLGGYDLSGDTRSLGIDLGADMLDVTPINQTTRIFAPGLRTARATLQGFVNTGTDGNPDLALFGNIGVAGTPITLIAGAGTEGDPTYTLNGCQGQYSPGAAVGEMLAYTVEAQSAGHAAVRGTLVHNAARTTTGNGTSFQLGAVSAAQRMYAALHVTAVSGTPSVTVLIQSDDNAGFTSATTRGTFSAATAVGAQFLTPVAGAITDTYWRAQWTISGGTPSATFAVVIGIF